MQPNQDNSRISSNDSHKNYPQQRGQGQYPQQQYYQGQGQQGFQQGNQGQYSQQQQYYQGQQGQQRQYPQGNQQYPQQGQYYQKQPYSQQGNRSQQGSSYGRQMEGLPSRSTQSGESFNQPAKNNIECKYKILPRTDDFNKIDKPTMKGEYLTNYYNYRQNHCEKDNIYLYSVETRPTIPPDNHDLWYRLIRSISKKLEKIIGVITYRANTIWGQMRRDSPFSTTTKLRPDRRGDPNQPQSSKGELYFDLQIKMTKVLKLEDLYKSDDSASKPLFVQMVNNSIKERMHELGYFELGKGRFYSQAELKQEGIKREGLTIMQGFRFTFISLAPLKSYLQIDTCSRVLRTENFYETLVHAPGGPSEKAQKFKGATLLARYGNHKTYTVE
jgi:hypothetical protein